jgi:hypothetical protein
MEFTLQEYSVLLERSEYFRAAHRFQINTDGSTSGSVNIELAGELHVLPGVCLNILKIVAISNVNVQRLMQFDVHTLVNIADFFSIEEIFSILDKWYFDLCTDKAPNYLWELGQLYTFRHPLVTSRVTRLCKIFPEISEQFIATATLRVFKKKIRDITRARKYHNEVLVNSCIICNKTCICKPYEQVLSKRGAISPCCGTFLHKNCIFRFIKNTYCPKCLTLLEDGIPFTEGENLHTTLLRIKIRDQNEIPRDANLPSLVPTYCDYKTTEANWICNASLCKQPLKPKHTLKGPQVFPKTCP